MVMDGTHGVDTPAALVVPGITCRANRCHTCDGTAASQVDARMKTACSVETVLGGMMKTVPVSLHMCASVRGPVRRVSLASTQMALEHVRHAPLSSTHHREHPHAHPAPLASTHHREHPHARPAPLASTRRLVPLTAARAPSPYVKRDFFEYRV